MVNEIITDLNVWKYGDRCLYLYYKLINISCSSIKSVIKLVLQYPWLKAYEWDFNHGLNQCIQEQFKPNNIVYRQPLILDTSDARVTYQSRVIQR